MITVPRCLHPVENRSLNRPRDFPDPSPVCWRPAGHQNRGTQHLARETYLHYLRQHRIAQAARRAQAKMSDPASRMEP